MNAACVTASAWFHRAAPTRRGHDRRLFVDVVCAGLPMVGMLGVFRSGRFERLSSVAFLVALTLASYAEILLKRDSPLRSVVVVVYFGYVQYAAIAESPPAWAAAQAVVFALCFLCFLYVDARRKRRSAAASSRNLFSAAAWSICARFSWTKASTFGALDCLALMGTSSRLDFLFIGTTPANSCFALRSSSSATLDASRAAARSASSFFFVTIFGCPWLPRSAQVVRWRVLSYLYESHVQQPCSSGVTPRFWANAHSAPWI